MIMSKWRTSKQEHLKHFLRRSTQTSNTGNVQLWLQVAILFSLRGCRLVKMRLKLSLENISYDRFEVNEGKSISDTLGFIVKCTFNRAIVKEDKV